jgi:hypothetical protein
MANASRKNRNFVLGLSAWREPNLRQIFESKEERVEIFERTSQKYYPILAFKKALWAVGIGNEICNRCGKTQR